MKIVEPKYEILTDISEGGIKELQQIELECLLLRTSAKKNRESSDIQDGSCF